VTSLTLTPAETPTAVNMTITNSTNISNLDCFELILCVNPNTVITGEPLPYTITVNGVAVSLLNIYSLPIYSNRLKVRKRYYGSYEVPTTGTPFVILWNTPDCSRYARP
jgi:hypothetical protein